MQDPYYPIFWAIDQVLMLFLIVLVVRIVLSWLFAFQVINPRHPVAWQADRFTRAVTDPVMRPIARALRRIPAGRRPRTPFNTCTPPGALVHRAPDGIPSPGRACSCRRRR